MKIFNRASFSRGAFSPSRVIAHGAVIAFLWAWTGRAEPAAVQPEDARSGLLYFKKKEQAGGPVDLWVQSRDGRRHRRLTSSGRVVFFPPVLEPGPMQGAAISPDGRWVAYAEQQPPSPAHDKGEALVNGWQSLWLVGSDGKGRRKLLDITGMPGSEESFSMGSFVWSPDGASLAILRTYASRSDSSKYCPKVSIHRLEVDSGRVTPLVDKQEFGNSQLLGWSSGGKELAVFSLCGLREGNPGLLNEFLRAVPNTGGKPRSWSASGPVLSPGGAFVYLSQQPHPNPAPPGVFRLTEEGLASVMELSPAKPGFMAWRHRSPEGVFTTQDCQYRMFGACTDALSPRQMYRVDVSTRKITPVSMDASRIHVLAFSPDDSQALVSLAVQQKPKPTLMVRSWWAKLYLVPSQLLLSGASWEELRRQGTGMHGLHNWESSQHIQAYVGWVR